MTDECPYKFNCQNDDKCYRCFSQKLFKPKKNSQHTHKISNTKFKSLQNNDKDSWKDLEQKVVDAINNIPTINDARRSRNSGALWFEKGDVVDDLLHPECKERLGRSIKQGADKSMSIKKSWLDKAWEESKQTFKTMCLPFRFKNDFRIYVIFKLEDIGQLICTMKTYMKDNEELRAEIKILKEHFKNKEESNG